MSATVERVNRPGQGSLDLVVSCDGARTVIDRVRYDGIARCSRRFAVADAALIMLSQLGPGVVRGDEIRLTGRLRDRARLIVTSQTATRLLGGAPAASATAHWTLEPGATLDLIGEPIVGAADAEYTSATTIELSGTARATVSEIVCVPAGANVRVRTVVRRDGRDLWYDAIAPAAAAPAAVGTFAVIGILPDLIDELVATLDGVADFSTDVRIGVGALTCGVVARLLASDLWSVRATIDAMRSAARELVAGYFTAQVPSFGSDGFAPATGPILTVANVGESLAGNGLLPAG